MMRVNRVLVPACLLAGLVLPTRPGIAADESAKDSRAEKPPWQRPLRGEDAKKAEEQEKQLAQLQEAGKFAEALKVAEALADLRGREQGAEHWEAVNARSAVDALRRVLNRKDEEQAAYASCFALQRQAEVLEGKGRHREAQPLREQSLAVYRRVLGEDHLQTAYGYDSLSGNLNSRGKYAEAEPFKRKAVAIRQKALGEEHPLTVVSYNNLAANLHAQGKYAEAESLLRKALAVTLKARGEDHPHLAPRYYSLARNLSAQGKYAEAEPLARKALAIRQKALGEEHPETAGSYNDLAQLLNAQGKYPEAEETWRSAANSFASARLRIAASGLERAAKTGEGSPLLGLAAVLARNGKPDDAWQRFEESLARGTWDDLSAGLRRPAAEQARQAELVSGLRRVDQLIEKTFSPTGDTDELKKRREELLTRRRRAQEELDAFGQHLDKAYGPAAGQVFARPKIQAALPADAALVGWLDIPGHAKAADPDGEHWAVLLRASGDPLWARLRGSGDKGAWTDADGGLPAELRAALQSPKGDWRPLARRLREQRLAPLAKHLDGVRRLLVLPSAALAGVPAETFADGYTVSYVPSGTLYAHLHSQPKVTARGLLALADPAFEAPGVAEEAGPLPPGGALVTMVAPGSNAAAAGLRPNDVLLRYDRKDLAGPADLKALLEAKRDDRPLTVTVWRGGKTLEATVRPGKLGVVMADEPAPRALARQRKLDTRLASRGGDDRWEPLPGTRAEVAALERLCARGGESPRVLVDSSASEQQLYQLAQDGTLATYRYPHLATHGTVDDRAPLRSAVILARDRLPDPAGQLDAGLPAFDGQLTAREVLEGWHLNAELVTLSACQTALGKYERGEGFVGFAQALLLAGSRGVCLSLWKVDDAATALLMERFYQNLLGRREGLESPMGKAQALEEAKRWLRNLSREEALARVAKLGEGVPRGKGRPVQPLLPAAPAGADDRPYAHPYYWAAFVLIGDPG